MKEINKCCDSIISKINNPEKGFEILYEEPNFKLIFNSIEKNKEYLFINKFKDKNNLIDLPNFSIRGSVAIKYCPFCGSKLEINKINI
ncbi:hypothetical protein [Flavobacterium fontis]|uniref:hypothetical protein n=1 Tax=Flavobacterium fontis TaxID=1124188 RepID=UPI0009343692|nr:hypothetical protein [Flavobacterium fontis]